MSTSAAEITLPEPAMSKQRPFFFFFMTDLLAIQSLRNHLSVHDRYVHKKKQDYKEIVHESQETEKCLWEDVKGGGQIGDCTNQAEKYSNSEHPEESTHRKHLPKGMTKQGGHISQPVHKLRRQMRENIMRNSVLSILHQIIMHFTSQYLNFILLLPPVLHNRHSSEEKI